MRIDGDEVCLEPVGRRILNRNNSLPGVRPYLNPRNDHGMILLARFDPRLLLLPVKAADPEKSSHGRPTLDGPEKA